MNSPVQRSLLLTVEKETRQTMNALHLMFLFSDPSILFAFVHLNQVFF